MQVYRVSDQGAEKFVAILTAHGHEALIERYSSDAVYVIAPTNDSEIADLVRATCRSARRVPSCTEMTATTLKTGRGLDLVAGFIGAQRASLRWI